MDTEEIDLSKVQIEWYSKIFRGLHAACDIKKGDLVLDIPWKNIMMTNRCVSTPIGKKMMSTDGKTPRYG